MKSFSYVGCCGIDCGLCPRFHTNGPSACPGCDGDNFHEKHPSYGFVTHHASHVTILPHHASQEHFTKIKGKNPVEMTKIKGEIAKLFPSPVTFPRFKALYYRNQ
jgi:hypothetical protein